MTPDRAGVGGLLPLLLLLLPLLLLLLLLQHLLLLLLLLLLIRRPLPCQGSLAVKASVEVKESSGRDQPQ